MRGFRPSEENTWMPQSRNAPNPFCKDGVLLAHQAGLAARAAPGSAPSTLPRSPERAGRAVTQHAMGVWFCSA